MPTTGTGNTPRTTGPRGTRKRPGDLTGQTDQRLRKEVAAQKAEERTAAELALEEEKAVKRATTVDYTGQQTIEPEVVEEEVELRPKNETIMVTYPIEDMTYGREVLDPGELNDKGEYVRAPRLGNLRRFDFEEGVKYTVPSDLADHLRSLGYVYEY
jgi:hypothetical protein